VENTVEMAAFWVIAPCSIIQDRRFRFDVTLMIAVSNSEKSVYYATTRTIRQKAVIFILAAVRTRNVNEGYRV
jgi:hypothetical protein